MFIWGLLKKLKFREIATLSKIFFENPRYFLPTIKATAETIKVCDYKFGNEHHLENPTNAFRHALWNYLICARCFKISGSVGRAMEWAKTITDIHEDLSPNNELAKAMDLHNNKVGREIFLKYPVDIPAARKALKRMIYNAKYIRNVEDIKSNPNQLVYIEN